MVLKGACNDDVMGRAVSTKLNEQAWMLNTSLPFDQRTALQDVRVDCWAEALRNANVLSRKRLHRSSLVCMRLKMNF
jgi:hypothetical protein